MNAINEEVIKQLDNQFTKAENDPKVKAIVLEGAGKAFIAGADISFFIKKIKDNKINDIYKFTKYGHDVLNKLDNSKKLVIAKLDGLALGGGASRGWAHIGVINALSELDIHPEIVCGCSIGAIVGASYVSGNLESLEAWVCSLTKVGLARFFELNLSLNGFVDTEKLHEFFLENVCHEQQTIEDAKTIFFTVLLRQHLRRLTVPMRLFSASS